MIYLFKCNSCDMTGEIDKLMEDPFPVVHCCNCGIEMIRDYCAESSSKATIIPEDFKAVNQTKSKFNYDQKPSGLKKNFFTS